MNDYNFSFIYSELLFNKIWSESNQAQKIKSPFRINADSDMIFPNRNMSHFPLVEVYTRTWLKGVCTFI